MAHENDEGGARARAVGPGQRREHLDTLMSEFEQGWLAKRDLRLFVREHALTFAVGGAVALAIAGGAAWRRYQRRLLAARLVRAGEVVGRLAVAIDRGRGVDLERSALRESLAAGAKGVALVLARRLVASLLR